MAHLLLFVCGVLFALGLGISGMTQPAKIVNFLDFTGPGWDPSLAFVMLGAVSTYYLGQRLILRRGKPAMAELGQSFQLPTATRVDLPMAIGNVIFGVGWGLAGFCPGPALVASLTGETSPILFLMAMACGMYAYGAVADHLLSRPAPVVDGGAGWRERAMQLATANRGK